MCSKLDQLLKSLSLLYPKEIDLNLERIERLLNKIGNPHLNLPPTIHIAGTNGKGSTLAFLKSLLVKHGFFVDRYISPHLHEITERIELSNQKITLEQFYETLNFVEKANERAQLTLFEALTASAFYLFSKNYKQGASRFLLLETGLGGLFDATNVIKNPALTIITTIGLDHTEFLGDQIEDIAYEKAGIIKSHTPVLSAPQSENVLKVLKNESHKKKSPFYLLGDNLPFISKNLSLLGDHQIMNSSLAFHSFQFLSQMYHFKTDDFLIDLALQETNWEGRLDIYKHDNIRFIVDAAHNPCGAKVLNEFLKKNPPHFAIIGLKKRKDAFSFLKELTVLKEVKTYFVPVVEGDGESHDPNDLCKIAKELDINAFSFHSLEEALNAFLDAEKTNPCDIVITGSLFMIKDIKKFFINFKF